MRRYLSSLVLGVVVACWATLPAIAQSSSPRAALVLEQGATAYQQIVAVSRDLLIEGDCRAGAAVLAGSATVHGSVAGDLLVLGGSARLGPEALVEGDVYVLGGELEAASGATIRGRSVAYPTAPSTWILWLEGPSMGRSALDPFVLGSKLALIAAWVLVTIVLLSVSRRQLEATATVVREEPFRSFFAGLTGVLAVVLTVVLLSSFVVGAFGVPVVVLLGLLALMFKLWGTSAVFLSFGAWLLGRLKRRELALTAALVGALVLGILKLVPAVGIWVWTVVTLIGVGATWTSKFGRMEAWIP